MKEKQTWSLSEHNTLYGVNFNKGLAKWLLQNLKFDSLLEFGCGPGYYCKFWNDNGVETVHGIEPELMDKNNFMNEGCEQFCYDITNQDEPDGILPHYDVITTIEVLEHIDQKFHDIIFDYFVSKNPKAIIFSAARPGQAGHGHIACRTKEDWASELIKRGYELNQIQTDDICESSDKKNVNHRRNLQIFYKK